MSLVLLGVGVLGLAVSVVAAGVAIAKPAQRGFAICVAVLGFGLASAMGALFVFVVSRMS